VNAPPAHPSNALTPSKRKEIARRTAEAKHDATQRLRLQKALNALRS